MARVGRGQPSRGRPQPPQRGRPAAAAPPGVTGGNYFAGVLDELRKVVWPTWDELGRMTGVVVTTVVLMAIIVSAADYGLGVVVRQLYTANSASSAGGVTGSKVSAQPTVKATPRASASPAVSASASPTSSGTSTAPVTP